MTYRRLFICLCLAGLCMLAGAWWSSLHNASGLIISGPRGRPSVGLGVILGSFNVAFSPNVNLSGLSGPWFKVFANPVGQVDPSFRSQYGLMGNLNWGTEGLTVAGGKVMDVHYYINLPLWLVYLVFVTIAYLALRRPMRKQHPRFRLSSNS